MYGCRRSSCRSSKSHTASSSDVNNALSKTFPQSSERKTNYSYCRTTTKHPNWLSAMRCLTFWNIFHDMSRRQQQQDKHTDGLTVASRLPSRNSFHLGRKLPTAFPDLPSHSDPLRWLLETQRNAPCWSTDATMSPSSQLLPALQCQ